MYKGKNNDVFISSRMIDPRATTSENALPNVGLFSWTANEVSGIKDVVAYAEAALKAAEEARGYAEEADVSASVARNYAIQSEASAKRSEASAVAADNSVSDAKEQVSLASAYAAVSSEQADLSASYAKEALESSGLSGFYVSQSKAWAITPYGEPVETDEENNPQYSSLAWAEASKRSAEASQTSAGQSSTSASKSEADANRSKTEADRAKSIADGLGSLGPFGETIESTDGTSSLKFKEKITTEFLGKLVVHQSPFFVDAPGSFTAEYHANGNIRGQIWEDGNPNENNLRQYLDRNFVSYSNYNNGPIQSQPNGTYYKSGTDNRRYGMWVGNDGESGIWDFNTNQYHYSVDVTGSIKLRGSSTVWQNDGDVKGSTWTQGGANGYLTDYLNKNFFKQGGVIQSTATVTYMWEPSKKNCWFINTDGTVGYKQNDKYPMMIRPAGHIILTNPANGKDGQVHNDINLSGGFMRDLPEYAWTGGNLANALAVLQRDKVNKSDVFSKTASDERYLGSYAIGGMVRSQDNGCYYYNGVPRNGYLWMSTGANDNGFYNSGGARQWGFDWGGNTTQAGNLSANGDIEGRDIKSRRNISGTGGLYMGGNGDFNDVQIRSDIRVKSNIKPIESPLSKLDKIDGYTYDKSGKPSVGIIAQEVQEIFPELVSADTGEFDKDSEGLLRVNYNGLIGLLVSAVKELKQEVEDLKSQIK